MIKIRSFLFNVFFFSWSAFLSVVLIPLLFIPSTAIYAGHIWGHGLIWAVGFICNIKYEVKGQENFPDKPCILVSKHQSAWETMIFFTLLKAPSYILKKELTKIPLFGKYLLAMGMIAVDRSAGTAALKQMAEDVKERLSRGCTIIIFPEGTRTAPGEETKYHPGIAFLYADDSIDAQFIPVALNSGYFWRRNSFIKKPGTITLEYLPEIKRGLKRKDFMNKIQQDIETKCKELAV